MSAQAHRMRSVTLYALSALAGAFLVVGFAPFGFSIAPFVSLVALFYLWRESASPRERFFIGLMFGLGLYLVGVSWVYVSLSTYGGMPLWMGSIAVLGFTGLLALIIAAMGLIFHYCIPASKSVVTDNDKSGKQSILLFESLVLAALWTIFEWTKSWLLTGFPWLDVGYTQTNTWLFAFAPIGGVYLISFVVALTAAAIMLGISDRRIFAPVGVGLCVIISSYLLNGLNWSESIGQPLRVGVVQANVPIDHKWQAKYRRDIIDQVASLSDELNRQSALDLVVWPETALPVYWQQVDDNFWELVRPKGAALLTGLIDGSGSDQQIYNAAVLACEGDTHIYRKRHLVPFGEYLPLRFLFNWVLEYLELPMSDFSSWQGQQDLSCGDSIKIGLSICYEDAFAAEYREHVGDATILVNISEDAWFGDSLAPHQRTQMAQMRARELARPMVRSSNPGPSFVIDQLGNIQTISAQYQVASFSEMVQPHTGDTPFKRYGNWIIYLSFLIVVVSLVTNRRA